MTRHKITRYRVFPDTPSGEWEYEGSGSTGRNSYGYSGLESSVQKLIDVSGKFTNHIDDASIHVSPEDRLRWDSAGNVDLSMLKSVAFTGLYNDLEGKPTIPEVLSQITTSASPVSSSAIKTALDKKADATDLDLYVELTKYTSEMAQKQNVLTAGRGISIDGSVISSTLDTDVYVIVESLGDPSSADPDKIYILEQPQPGGGYIYDQYRVKDGEWAYIGIVVPTVDLQGYLTETAADYKYQPIGAYLTPNDIKDLAQESEIRDIQDFLALCALKSELTNSISNLRLEFNNTFVKKGEISTTPTTPDTPSGLSRSDFSDVAFSGDYNDLIGKPIIPTVISQLSSTSESPVQSKVIKQALDRKADSADLNGYVDLDRFVRDMSKKQNILTAGDGISIVGNVISSTLDTDVYVIVDDLGDPSQADPDKIYILETVQDNEYTYDQYRVKNNRWVYIGDVTPTVDLQGYLKKDDADNYYQEKGEYLKHNDLQGYARLEDLDGVTVDLTGYAQTVYVDNQTNYVKDWVEHLYAKKTDIPTVIPGTGGTTVNITVDTSLNEGSNNPIANSAVTQAINQRPKSTDLSLVAFSGSYNDLSNKPTIPTIDTVLANTNNPVQNRVIKQALDAKLNIDDLPEVDTAFDLFSSRAIANMVVYAALNNKADASSLNLYALKTELDDKVDSSELQYYVETSDFNTAMAGKQNLLHEGYGIDIDNQGNISVTLDTSPFVIVSTLPVGANINPNKIYLLETISDGETVYIEKRWDSTLNDWITIGEKQIGVDLSEYIKESDADNKYLIPSGTYLTPHQASQTYQPLPPLGDDYVLESQLYNYQEKGNYVDVETLQAFQKTLDNNYAPKNASYLTTGLLGNYLTALQRIIDDKYVLKSDVRNRMHIEVDGWTYSSPVNISVGNALPGGSVPGSSSGISNMVTLTTEEYDLLVQNGLVSENTYYFTYEAEPPTSWGFGDNFPILLTDQWTFGGAFPINLT